MESGEGDDEVAAAHHRWSLSEQAYVCDSSAGGARTPLHDSAMSAVAVYQGSDTALTAGEDGVVRQVQIAESGAVNTGKWGQDVADWVALYDIKYANSNPFNFFTAGAAGGLRMWDVRAPESSRTYGAGSCFVSIEPLETFLMAGGETGEICIFDTRSDRGPLYCHSSGQAGGVCDAEQHTAEVWTIRACGGEVGKILSCCADGTVLSCVPEFERGISLKTVGWHRYSQAVNDVDAYVIDPHLKTENTLIMCAADSGLLLGEKTSLASQGMAVE
jgi:WD40 repeat protein